MPSRPFGRIDANLLGQSELIGENAKEPFRGLAPGRMAEPLANGPLERLAGGRILDPVAQGLKPGVFVARIETGGKLADHLLSAPPGEA